MLEKFGTPLKVFSATTAELAKVEGLGEARAKKIKKTLDTKSKFLKKSNQKPYMILKIKKKKKDLLFYLSIFSNISTTFSNSTSGTILISLKLATPPSIANF